MDRSDIIYLVTNNRTQNAYGIWEDNYETRQVFAEVTSVTSSEWFEGGRNGLNPEYRFRLFRYDYNDEETVIYNDTYYSIYRSYVGKDEIIDLYAEKKKGV